MLYHLQKFIYEAKFSQDSFSKRDSYKALIKTDQVNSMVFSTHTIKIQFHRGHAGYLY